jgi:hypothetical protein
MVDWCGFADPRPSTKPHLHYKLRNVMSCVRMPGPPTGVGIQKYQNYVDNTF